MGIVKTYKDADAEGATDIWLMPGEGIEEGLLLGVAPPGQVTAIVQQFLDDVDVQAKDFDWKPEGIPLNKNPTDTDPLAWLDNAVMGPATVSAAGLPITKKDLPFDPSDPFGVAPKLAIPIKLQQDAGLGDFIGAENGPYKVVALSSSAGLKVAVRVKALAVHGGDQTLVGLSIKIFGAQYPKFIDIFKNQVKLSANNDYASLHAQVPDMILARKTVGSILAASGVIWNEVDWVNMGQ